MIMKKQMYRYNAKKLKYIKCEITFELRIIHFKSKFLFHVLKKRPAKFIINSILPSCPPSSCAAFVTLCSN